MIETAAFARAGLLGNPSDGYFGKTIAFTIENFVSRTLLYPSRRIEIKPSAGDIPIWESLQDLHDNTRWRGYYGGIRIIRALLMRFTDYCASEGIALKNHNFTIEYESNIPLRLGLGGSSAIIMATLRALMQYFEVDISLARQANLVLETETRELAVRAGLQDRVVQAYEGLVFMNFPRDLMEQRGYGEYEVLAVTKLPNFYVAYRTKLSEGTEVFHNDLHQRYYGGEKAVIDAMGKWAEIAQQGRQALLQGDTTKLGNLIDTNFDLRKTISRISPANMQMVNAARQCGATAKFAGSGGAIVGTYSDEDHFDRLRESLMQQDIAVIRPQISKH